jgi:hypothetical protein
MYKFDAILGGTAEILADLGWRQAMKNMPKIVPRRGLLLQQRMSKRAVC